MNTALRSLFISSLVAAIATPTNAFATGSASSGSASSGSDAPNPGASASVVPTTSRQRAFIATTLDFGYKYVRPRLSAGYGRPFETWFGLDLNPEASNTHVGGYAGVRLATPVVDVRSGLLYNRSFFHSLLPVERSTTRAEAEVLLGGEPASYFAASSELTLDVPLGGGLRLLSETESVGLLGVRRDRYVFVESVGVVTNPTWLLRQRLGLSAAAASIEGLSVGGAAEIVVLPGRNEHVWRAGPLARWRLFENFDLRFTALPVIVSPDSLGLLGGEFEFGLRWRWTPHG
jgi:hypothetical protein